jgi:hypothetical protein
MKIKMLVSKRSVYQEQALVTQSPISVFKIKFYFKALVAVFLIFLFLSIMSSTYTSQTYLKIVNPQDNVINFKDPTPKDRTLSPIGFLSFCNEALAEINPIKKDSKESVTGLSETAKSTDPIVILPPGGPGAATNLRVELDCDKVDLRKGIAKLSWTIAANPGREQRVQVTIFINGFAKNKFEISDSLPPNQRFIVWDQVKGQAIHRWRVLTLQAKGWIPSDTNMFEGPSCVADFVPKP